MILFKLTDSTTTAAGGVVGNPHAIPLWVYAAGVSVVCMIIAILILASYVLYPGASLKDVLEERRVRRGARRQSP